MVSIASIAKYISPIIYLIIGILLVIAYFNQNLRKRIPFIPEDKKWLYLLLGIIILVTAAIYAFN